MPGGAEWEPDAENWVRWARTPGFDAYWYFRDNFFDHVLPAPGRRTLEIGCGEGRVARDLTARKHRVVATDTAQTLLRYAREADDESAYARADGAALPFPDRSFDLVVAYNSLQVVSDMAGTVLEIGRVLDPGGHLCACIAHPVTDLGHFPGNDPNAPYELRPRYFESVRVEETVELDGHTMTFRGWTYSLEHYSLALEQAGLHIEAIREPQPNGGPQKYEQWRAVPLFLSFRAVKP